MQLQQCSKLECNRIDFNMSFENRRYKTEKALCVKPLSIIMIFSAYVNFEDIEVLQFSIKRDYRTTKKY